jgi:dihydrolipoamide dehydrogenase
MVVGDVTTAVDVLVVGSGPGGYVAAIRAAQLGHHVTLIDSGPLGGACLHRGCIPLKALLSASERYAQTRQEDLAAMGIHAAPVSFNWSEMQAWKQSVVDRLADGVRRLVAGNRIDYVHGTGWFMNAQEMRVEGEHGSLRYKFEHCIIATGTSSATIDHLPYDGRHLLTPEQALMLSELPETLGIFGDDYIALELATIFARLGVKVKLYLPGEQLLPGIDPAALRLVQAGLRKLGVTITTKASPVAIEDRPLVLSVGMLPNTAGVRPAAAGVALAEHGGVSVNAMQQTSMPHIYAVGDCTGGYGDNSRNSRYLLASIAIKQGKVAAEALSGQRVQFAPLVVPLVVHTTPELATVGYSAEAAAQAGYKIITGKFPLAGNGRALTLGADNGTTMIVANAEDSTILGATFVGPRVGDLVGQTALAIEMGATLTDLAEIIYAHPGLSETMLESAENALGRAIHMQTRV